MGTNIMKFGVLLLLLLLSCDAKHHTKPFYILGQLYLHNTGSFGIH